VIDDAGATATATKTIGLIALTAHGYKLKGLQTVELAWNAPTESRYDVYRDGAKIATTAASSYTDNLNRKGSDSHGYKVCETAGASCSNTASVSF
jgi:hypothetical protein